MKPNEDVTKIDQSKSHLIDQTDAHINVVDERSTIKVETVAKNKNEESNPDSTLI